MIRRGRDEPRLDLFGAEYVKQQTLIHRSQLVAMARAPGNAHSRERVADEALRELVGEAVAWSISGDGPPPETIAKARLAYEAALLEEIDLRRAELAEYAEATDGTPPPTREQREASDNREMLAAVLLAMRTWLVERDR